MGAAKLENAMPVRTLGIANIIVGATSIVASASALLRKPERDLTQARNTSPGVAVSVLAGVDRSLGTVAGLHAAF